MRHTWPRLGGPARERSPLRQALAQRRAVRAELELDARFLRPGLWALESARMARHVRTGHPPTALVRAKAGGATRGSGPAGTARWLLRRVFGLTWVRRSTVTRPEERAHAGRYAIWLARTYTPESVLFDLEQQQVLRIRQDGTEARSAVPRLLSQHVGVAPFVALAGGRIFVEELVCGTPFSEASLAQRSTAFRQLLAGYTSLAGSEGTGSCGPLVEAATRRAGSVTLPPVLAAWLNDNTEALFAASTRWPLVPSHSDLTGDNVLLRSDRPVLIDFEWAGYYPYFYDPLSLALREAADGREDVLDPCCRGVFDDEFEALCRAADSRETDLTTLLVATLLVRCDRMTRRSDLLDDARYERHLAHLWQPLRRVLA